MKRDKKYFEKRVARLQHVLGKKLGYNQIFHLSSYMPGRSTRYQIQIVDKTTGLEHKCFPRHAHYNPNDFDRYLEGMLDVLEDFPLNDKK